ncbi:DUF4148 domain-containing protein [Paraburkholderia sp. B3]|uniref:DUF4148 domain-containing protein n=1 Tax=Paraburkholderia sp. B3 TaxID=3134791 RepID=UPI003981D5DF
MRTRWNGVCAALTLSMSALAQAQGVPSTPVAGQADTVQQAAATVTSNGPLTRAQVYQQLVRAERDGQLQMLNKTIYAHH